MALSAPSLFIYGLEITQQNSSIDFRAVSLGPVLMATLNVGFYSLTSLAVEVVRALQAVDPAHSYACTVDRTVDGGKQNRVTISTSSTYLDLLFAGGARSASTTALILGFPKVDQTGATSYTGTSTAGTRLITDRPGYNFLPVEFSKENFGKVNVSASGLKEAVIYSIQQFWQVQFKYIKSADVFSDWQFLMTWMIQQRPIDYTPELTTPTRVFTGSLEKTPASGQALSFKFTEMLPEYPNIYDTGLMVFRKDPLI
jgi:tRNA A37 threonylcarbamoyltransferase TsaD